MITEGLQDTQDWTVEKLGLEVDFLATTNAFGVSKVDELFGKVLERLGIEAKDLAYVGTMRSEMFLLRERRVSLWCITMRKPVCSWNRKR